MKTSLSYFIVLMLLTVATSCHKTKETPCPAELTDGPPIEIVLKFISKQTGETLTPDPAVIKVTETQTGNLYKNWRVLNRTGFATLNGAITLAIFSETVREYHYAIEVGDRGKATLSYKISRQESGNRCRPFSYQITDIKIVDQSFNVFQFEGKTYPKILVVSL
jgi:hypothetical protein